MIYDNKYCVQQAEWLIRRFGKDDKELTKEISGELCRFYRLGQHSVLSRVTKALYEADQTKPT